MSNYGQALKTSYYNINTAPLDGKLTPVLTLEDLKALDTSTFYEGMELTVLNVNKEDENDTTNIPVRFNVKYNEKFEFVWKIKDGLTVKTNKDIEQFKEFLLDGTKITVLHDETNHNQLTEYLSKTNNETKETEFKKINNDGVITNDELIIKKLNNGEIGSLICPQNSIYSYSKDIEGNTKTVYTLDLLEAEGQPNFLKIDSGFYIIQLGQNSQQILSQMVSVTVEENPSINIPIIGDDF